MRIVICSEIRPVANAPTTSKISAAEVESPFGRSNGSTTSMVMATRATNPNIKTEMK